MAANSDEYRHLLALLQKGDIGLLEEAAQVIESFPCGQDHFLQRQWISNAIDCGSLESIEWVLSKEADLSFTDSEGYTPLLSALERERPDKYEVLRLLIEHGAPLDKKGINDWTPLHKAAVSEDIEALKILVAAGADLSIRTEIDDYATPLEEARNLKKMSSVKFLESVT